MGRVGIEPSSIAPPQPPTTTPSGDPNTKRRDATLDDDTCDEARSRAGIGPRGAKPLVGRVGIEPTTFGLKARCSAWLSYRPGVAQDGQEQQRNQCHTPDTPSASGTRRA